MDLSLVQRVIGAQTLALGLQQELLAIQVQLVYGVPPEALAAGQVPATPATPPPPVPASKVVTPPPPPLPPPAPTPAAEPKPDPEALKANVCKRCARTLLPIPRFESNEAMSVKRRADLPAINGYCMNETCMMFGETQPLKVPVALTGDVPKDLPQQGVCKKCSRALTPMPRTLVRPDETEKELPPIQGRCTNPLCPLYEPSTEELPMDHPRLQPLDGN